MFCRLGATPPKRQNILFPIFGVESYPGDRQESLGGSHTRWGEKKTFEKKPWSNAAVIEGQCSGNYAQVHY